MDVESGEFMEKAELAYAGRSESRVETGETGTRLSERRSELIPETR